MTVCSVCGDRFLKTKNMHKGKEKCSKCETIQKNQYMRDYRNKQNIDKIIKK